ncbi:MAG: hypothetical protein Q9169_004973 [Polycauliona sp. 2 TL-2023]
MLLNHVTAIPQNYLSLPTLAKATNLATSTSDLIKVWADQARSYPWRQSETTERAVVVLEAMFEGKGTPDPSRTAAKLAEIYNPALRAGFRISPVVALWGMICEAAQILGGDMEIAKQLVQLLNAIARLPDVLDENDRPIGPHGLAPADYVYWRKLPELPIMFREYLGTRPPPLYLNTDIDQESGEHEPYVLTDAQSKMLLDYTTFGALYFLYGEVDLGMSFHADVSLAGDIEQTPYQTSEEQRGARVVVPPAATWILIAGQDLYDLCKAHAEVRERQYDLRRWALWKTRFLAIAVNEGLTDNVKGYAARAVSRMTEIEIPR